MPRSRSRKPTASGFHAANKSGRTVYCKAHDKWFYATGTGLAFHANTCPELARVVGVEPVAPAATRTAESREDREARAIAEARERIAAMRENA